VIRMEGVITDGEYLILHLLLGETYLPSLRIRTWLSFFSFALGLVSSFFLFSFF